MIVTGSELVRTYGQGDRAVRALDHVCLAADAGEFVVVRGPSGCGKTTLLLTLGGLLAPQGGRVELTGHDPYALSPQKRAELRATQVGFVFQQFYLVPYLSVRDNVLCAALAAGNADDPQRRSDELIEQMGLTSRRDHRPAELSTGEKQRTALARAMLNRPPLLLADEPTGNLDEASAQAVMDTLGQYAASGAAVVLVTHDPRWDRQAGRTVRMEYGRVVE